MTLAPPRFLASMSALALLVGCASGVKLTDAPPVESRTGTPVASSGAAGQTPSATTSGTPQSSVATVNLSQPGGQPSASAAQIARIVYFDFDSYVIKPEFQPTLEGFARVLGASASKQLVIEGHADERGSREYNLALGQKRATAVLNSLKLLGAKEGQMEAVSFGEERPAATGNDESAWAKNRRAELKDR